jgi:hypothetical protein
MKPQKIQLAPLRDHVRSWLDRLATKHPDHASAFSLLKEGALSILSAEATDFETLQGFLEAIVKRADELDDGYAFAGAQDLSSKLDGLARGALSEGVPVFPELQVGLSLPSGQSVRSEPEPGSRTRFGGKPEWIQSDETPICRRCQKTMAFIAQIDSIANQDTEVGRFLSKQNSFMFADVGMIYVFWCHRCNGTEAVLQCT